MNLTLKDVEKIATLARVSLTDEEKKEYQEQLSTILRYAEQLAEIDSIELDPLVGGVQKSVWREDQIQPSLSLEDLLYNAQNQAEEQFAIQSVIEEGTTDE